MTKSERIPLGESLRLFWHHLVPLACLPTLIICVLGLTQKQWLLGLMLPFFYGCGYYAGLPFLKKNATYWFWVLACVIWVLAAVPGMFVFAILKRLLSA